MSLLPAPTHKRVELSALILSSASALDRHYRVFRHAPKAAKTPTPSPSSEASAPASEDTYLNTTTLRVMTFNIKGGGGYDNKPVDETAAVIKAAKADIIGIQESPRYSNGPSVASALAESLGFYYYDQEKENAAIMTNSILSRYPILTGATENDLGVSIDIGYKVVHFFNIHLISFPYQPYQLLDLPYEGAPFLDTAEEAVQAATDARGPALELLMTDLKNLGEDDIVFLTGDFNEPSYRDWTDAAVAAGQQPLTVEYPSAKTVEEMGFVDALRLIFPDPVEKPAFTWTPNTDVDDPTDHHDRIDFVFVRGANVTVVDAAVVGEKSPEADIVVTPWPSDHRAIVADFVID